MTWRSGTRNPHTLYENDEPRGFMIRPEDAKRLVAAVNDAERARPITHIFVAMAALDQQWLEAWLPLDSLNPPSIRYGLNRYGRREVTLVWWHQGNQCVWAACRDTHEKALAEVLSHASVWPPLKPPVVGVDPSGERYHVPSVPRAQDNFPRDTCPCGDGTRPGHDLSWCREGLMKLGVSWVKNGSIV